jgi:hypothetical protein
LVPAFVEIRSLGAGMALMDALRSAWDSDPTSILKEGRALLLLDGLDEEHAAALIPGRWHWRRILSLRR